MSVDDAHSNVIVGIIIFRGSFVFSQSCVKVSASLTNVGSLAVRAFDLVNCSLSVLGSSLRIECGRFKKYSTPWEHDGRLC